MCEDTTKYQQVKRSMCLAHNHHHLLGAVLLGGSFPMSNNNSNMQQASANQNSGQTQTGSDKTVNIVLVHGLWADGSSWSKVIAILEKAGHRVIAVQLSLHSLADDVATVKRAVSLVGGPATILVALLT